MRRAAKKEFEIWAEGFAASGQFGQAQLLGKETARTFDEAMQQYMKKNPNRIRVSERYGEKGADGKMPVIKTYTDWGCRLFDNEADARKSFG